MHYFCAFDPTFYSLACILLLASTGLIPISEVGFLQADHKYVTVRHESDEVFDDILRGFENEFGDKLVYTHRSALVLTDHLEGLELDTTGH